MSKTSGHTREWIPELDGLRVLMIFIVSAYHIWQQSWLTPRIGDYSLDYLLRSGYVWVDGTVLLSSFLLFLPCVRAKREGQPLPGPGSFYAKRARRIIPSYFFIILLTFFAVALPWKLYSTPQFMVKDLATHLSFTFPFFYDTYITTPLGAASWTLAIEVHAYLLFPAISRWALKKPLLTFGGMAALSWGFRLWCIWSLSDFNMVVNQLINFLDVYALGMMLAMAYDRVKKRNDDLTGKKRLLLSIAATLVFFLAFWGLLRMMRVQANSSVYSEYNGIAGAIASWLGNTSNGNNYAVIQRNQMIYRPIFALCFGALLLSAPLSLRPLRFLLGNRVTHFLGSISMNYYLIHQVIIVHMKRLRFPPSLSDVPNQASEQPWQTQYTLLAFGISFAAAALITFLVEKPIARLISEKKSP